MRFEREGDPCWGLWVPSRRGHPGDEAMTKQMISNACLSVERFSCSCTIVFTVAMIMSLGFLLGCRVSDRRWRKLIVCSLFGHDMVIAFRSRSMRQTISLPASSARRKLLIATHTTLLPTLKGFSSSPASPPCGADSAPPPVEGAPAGVAAPPMAPWLCGGSASLLGCGDIVPMASVPLHRTGRGDTKGCMLLVMMSKIITIPLFMWCTSSKLSTTLMPMCLL
mmetsp:Transcript_38987/g.83496  ORF Transcript_38987/g.83496 Transcript_38987/m.83496 type:complete len:223 (+) Transcript_38987:680-1348(+)